MENGTFLALCSDTQDPASRNIGREKEREGEGGPFIRFPAGGPVNFGIKDVRVLAS